MSTLPRTTPAPDQPVLDLVDVGFGPSNLALAVAVEERNRRCAPHEQLHARFVERHPQLSWHGGNYSVVDGALIHEPYRREYQERVTGRRRLMTRRVSRVVDTTELADGVRVRVLDQVSGQHEDLVCDAVVYATRYRPRELAPLLGDLDAACPRDDAGRLHVQRDYRIATTPDVRAGEIVAALRPGSYPPPLNGSQLDGTELSAVELALIGGSA